ncbi:MAG: rhodanese-like domain-containing protein [Lachnospiraceae bacterium]
MKIQFIAAHELDNWLENQHAILADVRPREEYRTWHLSTAINLPLEESHIWLTRPPKQRLIIFYCKFGSSSLQACRLAIQQGWNAATLSGGYEHYHGKYRK